MECSYNNVDINTIETLFSEQQKGIFNLFYRMGCSYNDIVNITGLNLNTIKVTLHRIRKALQNTGTVSEVKQVKQVKKRKVKKRRSLGYSSKNSDGIRLVRLRSIKRIMFKRPRTKMFIEEKIVTTYPDAKITTYMF